MFKISNNGIITLTHGDTASAPLFLNAGTELNPIRYILKDSDELYFGLIEAGSTFENAILRKVYTKDNLNEYGDVIIEFKSKDTECLVANTYYYEIKLLTKGETTTSVTTVVSPTQFILID